MLYTKPLIQISRPIFSTFTQTGMPSGITGDNAELTEYIKSAVEQKYQQIQVYLQTGGYYRVSMSKTAQKLVGSTPSEIETFIETKIHEFFYGVV